VERDEKKVQQEGAAGDLKAAARDEKKVELEEKIAEKDEKAAEIEEMMAENDEQKSRQQLKRAEKKEKVAEKDEKAAEQEETKAAAAGVNDDALKKLLKTEMTVLKEELNTRQNVWKDKQNQNVEDKAEKTEVKVEKEEDTVETDEKKTEKDDRAANFKKAETDEAKAKKDEVKAEKDEGIFNKGSQSAETLERKAETGSNAKTGNQDDFLIKRYDLGAVHIPQSRSWLVRLGGLCGAGMAVLGFLGLAIRAQTISQAPVTTNGRQEARPRDYMPVDDDFDGCDEEAPLISEAALE